MLRIYLVLFVFLLFLSSCEKATTSHQLMRDAYNFTGVTFTNVEMKNEAYQLKRNIVAYSEILGYDSTNHAFLLSEGAGERIRDIHYPVTPTPFAIALDGDILYMANFIPGYSSLSCEECITIEPYSYDNKYRVTLGYPGGSPYHTGEDPRNDPRIITRLKQDNKLIP